jgi:hypothetical protein
MFANGRIRRGGIQKTSTLVGRVDIATTNVTLFDAASRLDSLALPKVGWLSEPSVEFPVTPR